MACACRARSLSGSSQVSQGKPECVYRISTTTTITTCTVLLLLLLTIITTTITTTATTTATTIINTAATGTLHQRLDGSVLEDGPGP